MDVDPTPGMVLRAGSTGRTYRLQSVGDDRVVASGPRGSVGVDRDELEDHIDRGLVGVVSWP